MFIRYLNLSVFLAGGVLITACAHPEAHRAATRDSPPPSVVSQSGDRHILAGDWEYEDGSVVPLTLDEQGNGHYYWKDGEIRTQAVIGNSWKGIWFQKGNDRDGGFTVKFSPDFSKGIGRWWYSRIGTDYAPKQKGGTFHVSKKTAVLNRSRTPPAP
ncbi:MAG TPA: hypothetical protein VLA67_08525 [Nitrospiraceae bacterium]|nr:hypothetical protein [Nitrospiraceae bacterium]